MLDWKRGWGAVEDLVANDEEQSAGIKKITPMAI